MQWDHWKVEDTKGEDWGLRYKSFLKRPACFNPPFLVLS